ncbi:hypothetical protein LEL_08971 [Akanthomyces lecanii RCEF 1005]|uniref:Uncharacterized protein n=1 Tax=Akanthomyces lecanii RCEF 1005 TaxID=1081108 RepID=A0A168CSJ6_CORDF|nr:hypothetical protein LEL_08971 [Akanthomyces lecanii RCEF 1005]
MAPVTCQLLDMQGRGVRGIQVTLYCETVFSHKVLEFRSLTDEDGGISMWFSSLSNYRATQLEPRLLDTSLLQDAQLTLFADSSRPNTPRNMACINLQLLSDALPAVIIHLAGTPQIEYRAQAVASPVNEWYHNVNQNADQPQAISPLQLPSPLVRLDPAAAPSINRKRKRDTEADESAEKRLKMVW